MAEPIIDPGLFPYCTDRQREIFEAVNRIGSIRGAAKELGCVQSLIHCYRKRVQEKAARRGYSPEHDYTHPLPPGMVLRGASIRYNGAGEIEQYWNRSRQEGRDPDKAFQLPDPKKVTQVSTNYDQDGQVLQQWVRERPEAVAIERAWKEFAQQLAADLPQLKPAKAPDDAASHLCAFYPVGDHHLGMLSWEGETGENWDIDIAEKMLNRAMAHLIRSVQPCETSVIALMGDFLHYDSMQAITPAHGNLLDADGRYPKMANAAIWTIRRAIDTALIIHRKVRVIVEPGNHDPSSSIMLALLLAHLYENEPRVEIDTSPAHFHYHRFGKVLIGTHHGHGAKMADLPLIMAVDRPGDWGETEHRYCFVGHEHHREAKDIKGVSVEMVRVLPPGDAYAHEKGFRHQRSMSAIVYHRDYGEVERHTVNPAMLDA